VAVDALANFNRDRQEDTVHARAEGPERENVERELGEVLPVGLVARSSRRLGRLRVKSGKSVDQSVFVRVARASFLPTHDASTRQSSSSITFACLDPPTRSSVRPRRRKSCPERIAALESCDRAPTPTTEARTETPATAAAVADAFRPPPARKRRVEIISNLNPPSSTVCARRVVANPSTRLSRESSRPPSTGIRASRIDYAPCHHRTSPGDAREITRCEKTMRFVPFPSWPCLRVASCTADGARGGRCHPRQGSGRCDTVCSYKASPCGFFGRHEFLWSLSGRSDQIRMNDGLLVNNSSNW
jgi:hypothetical protein